VKEKLRSSPCWRKGLGDEGRGVRLPLAGKHSRRKKGAGGLSHLLRVCGEDLTGVRVNPYRMGVVEVITEG